MTSKGHDSSKTSIAVKMPDGRFLKVALNGQSTAEDVVKFCRQKYNLASSYVLSANFDGLEKRFDEQERLYKLVKKFVIEGGRGKDVLFSLKATRRKSFAKEVEKKPLPVPIPKVNPATAMSTGQTSKSWRNSPRVPILRNIPVQELFLIAEQRSALINSNHAHIMEKDAKLKTMDRKNNATSAEQLAAMKHYLAGKEAQYAKLCKIRQEVEEANSQRKTLSDKLNEIKGLMKSKEAEHMKASKNLDRLKQVLLCVQKAQLLAAKRKELELIERKIRGTQTALYSFNLTDTVTAKDEEKTAKNEVENDAKNAAVVLKSQDKVEGPALRPKAAIEPFSVVQPSNLACVHGYSRGGDAACLPSDDYRSSKGFVTAFSAMEETLASCSAGSNVVSSDAKPSYFRSTAGQGGSMKECNDAQETSVVVVGSDKGEQLPCAEGAESQTTNLYVKLDVADGEGEEVRDSSKTEKVKVKSQSSVLTVDQATESPPPDLIPALDKSKFQTHEGKSGTEKTVATSRSTAKDYNRIESDKINVRGDTLRATKRRSWADHRCAVNDSETEHIQMLLCREQRKGKSSVNFSWILGQLVKSPPKSESIVLEPSSLVEKKALPVVVEVQGAADDSSVAPDASEVLEISLENDHLVDNVGPTADQGKLKPILKTKKSDEKKKVKFDPLALLLDAALEGELELVKRCAGEVDSVSSSNDEGITALHNAICAGHYDIVRFLVEVGANVNAQDSDGWTPLHCAASCNNLPMVKFLIERGACVFATTISDDETPADKCEEDEEGFIGCSQFLVNIQEKMGILNSGMVYAAFDFDARKDDELSLTAGEELEVVRRAENEEKGWWFVRSLRSGKEGFVPRNYLSLYLHLAELKVDCKYSAKEE